MKFLDVRCGVDQSGDGVYDHENALLRHVHVRDVDWDLRILDVDDDDEAHDGVVLRNDLHGEVHHDDVHGAWNDELSCIHRHAPVQPPPGNDGIFLELKIVVCDTRDETCSYSSL